MSSMAPPGPNTQPTPEQMAMIEAMQQPFELVRKGAERYDGLDRTKQGTWRAITSHGLPMGLAWTDWENGFDVRPLHDGAVSVRLGKYPEHAKAVGVTASWAFTTLEEYIKTFDPTDEVAMGPDQRGPLSGAADYSGDVPSYGTFVDTEED